MKEIKIKITWRLVLYIGIIAINMAVIPRAVIFYYKNVFVSSSIIVLYTMSYLFSIFLIRIKEEN